MLGHWLDYGHCPPRSFFATSAAELAASLLGHILVHDHPDGRTAGMIVETEAYDQTDPASHSHRGPSPRNQVMFGPGGHAYVYQSYGIHWCMNVTAGAVGFGAGVLLRALEPLVGLDLMARRRGTDGLRLARGPGCVTQALGITREQNGHDLRQAPLRLLRHPNPPSIEVVATARIGISKAVTVPWRFIVRGNPHVSGRRGGAT